MGIGTLALHCKEPNVYKTQPCGGIPATSNPKTVITNWAKTKGYQVTATAGGFDVSTGLFSDFKCAFLVWSPVVKKWAATHNMHPGECLDAYKYANPEEAWQAYNNR